MKKKYNLDLYKHNDFVKMIQVKKQMTLQQQRIFDTILATVQDMKKSGDFLDIVAEGDLVLDLTTFKEQMLKGANIKKINRAELEDALENMVDIKFKYSVKNNEVDEVGFFVIFQSAVIDFNTNEVKITFGKNFRTDNLLPTSNYTALSLDFLNTFSSQYARLLYQYFKMLIGKNNSNPFRTDIVLEIDFIKTLLGINEIEHKGYWNNISNLIKNTIEPAKKQINEFSDITVDFEKLKKGTRIYAIAFEFSPKPEFVKNKIEIKEENLTKPMFVPEFKTFKTFKNWVVDNYLGQSIAIGPIMWRHDLIVKLSMKGYLYNELSYKDFEPDDAIAIWEWLFSNQNRIGKIKMNRSEVLTDNYKGKFIFAVDKIDGKKKNFIVLKININNDSSSENDICDVTVSLNNTEERVISGVFTLAQLKSLLINEPFSDNTTLEAEIV